ncbi:hypothetical protein FHG87_005187 [Trinorchestia longiramus]|nr:hypothetical protein FHG87_005187 [Trinorchestia longiramus]
MEANKNDCKQASKRLPKFGDRNSISRHRERRRMSNRKLLTAKSDTAAARGGREAEEAKEAEEEEVDEAEEEEAEEGGGGGGRRRCVLLTADALKEPQLGTAGPRDDNVRLTLPIGTSHTKLYLLINLLSSFTCTAK